ncbi:hypothetical protein Bwad002_29060 [Bilophila wadsworthia]
MCSPGESFVRSVKAEDEEIGRGGETFLKKGLPAPPKPSPPASKAFNWWGGRVTEVPAGQRVKTKERLAGE